MTEAPRELEEHVLGALLPSLTRPGVVYRPMRRIGAGAMAVSYFALCSEQALIVPIVIKVLREPFVRRFGAAAALAAHKEAAALARLSECASPSLFIVRLLDTGVRAIADDGAEPIMLPWLALEFVHGGMLGTTLAERVRHCIRATGYAFDRLRAARAVECLSAGLEAVHECGIVHRDVKPSNVLCSGERESELFKLADFGVSRPADFAATFGGLVVGTPGYAAPEQTSADSCRIGSFSDVFSLAATVFYLLTGEAYLVLDSPGDVLCTARSPLRRSLRSAAALCPELADASSASSELDELLAKATAPRSSRRPQSAKQFGRAVCDVLRG